MYDFYLRDNLKTVIIPKGVKEIGECSNIINIAIPAV